MSWDAWVPQFNMSPVVWGGMFSDNGALCCSHVGAGGEKYAVDQATFANIKKSIDAGDACVKIKAGLMTLGVVKDESLKCCRSQEYCLIASKSKTVYIVVVTTGDDGKKPEKGFNIAENCARALRDSGC